MTLRTRKNISNAISYFFLCLVSLLFLAPIAYMIIGSFKPSDEVLNGLGGFLPTNLSLDNYSGVMGRFDSDASGYFWNFYLT
jgi:multiple sugar transport system permease protein